MPTDSIALDVRDGIAVITLDSPPVNSLGHALRAHIVACLDAAQAHQEVSGIVLTGTGKSFSAGADITEFGTPRQFQEPVLRTVIARIEASPKPVVAAINGVALGGGLELALACHGRVAFASARVGLPEVTLGLIPGAGGTQRLPRLIGIAAAYRLMATGRPQTAADLAATPLFDQVVQEDVVGAAVQLTLMLLRRGLPFPRACDRTYDAATVHAEVAALRDARNAREKLQPAYGALLDALTALTLPFEEGMQCERALFLSLVQSAAAQALRYQFKAEREAVRMPANLAASPRTVRVVAVIGAGTMGTGIALSALDAGLSVLLLEQDRAALTRGEERIADHYRQQVAAGKVDADTACHRQKHLSPTLDWARLEEADLVIEAVFEELAVKQQVFEKIDRHARAGAVLATNTSYLDVDAIADATSRPHDVLGLHFFSPANVMKLLEVVRGARTAADVLATGMAIGAVLKKTPVLTANAFGFIGNRIYNAYRRQCEFMLEDGAFPEDIDNALTDFGFAMGPFAVADLSGLDIAWRMRQSQAATRDPRERYVDVLDRLCELGRLGRKTHAGYYVYTDGKRAKATDGLVRELIIDASTRRGITRRALTPAKIQQRALMAMVNEAANLIAEGIAARSSDVDVVLVQGYGFPRWEGGPVFWARQQDRAQLERGLTQLAAEGGHGFVLANLDGLLATTMT